jgi:hypothetical protein
LTPLMSQTTHPHVSHPPRHVPPTFSSQKEARGRQHGITKFNACQSGLQPNPPPRRSTSPLPPSPPPCRSSSQPDSRGRRPGYGAYTELASGRPSIPRHRCWVCSPANAPCPCTAPAVSRRPPCTRDARKGKAAGLQRLQGKGGASLGERDSRWVGASCLQVRLSGVGRWWRWGNRGRRGLPGATWNDQFRRRSRRDVGRTGDALGTCGGRW